MKKPVILFFMLCTAFALYAQDVIVMHSGETIEAIVDEVGVNDVRYRRAVNPNGPVYTAMKSDIAVIRYANGDTESFAPLNARRNYNYGNFTTGERWATWAMNGFLIPGLGSYVVMKDWFGGSVMMGMGVLGSALGIAGYVMISDALDRDDDGREHRGRGEHRERGDRERIDSQKVETGAILLCTGAAVLLANGVYNIVRSATYNRPAPKRAGGFDPSAFSFALIPGSEGIEKVALSYTIKF